MNSLNFVRVHNGQLSLWQSVVSEYACTQLKAAGENISRNQLLRHPMVKAAAAHVEAAAKGTPPDEDQLDMDDLEQCSMYLSHLGLQYALCLVEGDTERAAAIEDKYRYFSDWDPGFLKCPAIYLEYYTRYEGKFAYNDWKLLGRNIQTFGVIGENNNGQGYNLPNDAKVAIIGDWGTGLNDARALLVDIIKQHSPAAIIHLGDIYYSGTPDECIDNFSRTIDEAFEIAGAARVPVFSIPGNHDYYAMGWGYYDMVSKLNSSLGSAALQPASYFCLRTEDQGWQFLGMDTGLNDANPMNQLDTTYASTWLQPNEIAWHQDKLNNFNGATILLSHHQLFSAHAKINGSLSRYGNMPYLNPSLYETFLPYFQTKIAAWIWGHEHNFVMYQNDLLQLAKGRLVGCSAFEELQLKTPYTVQYPEIPYFRDPRTGLPVELGMNSDPNGVKYYNHAYAIIDFSTRQQPSDPVSTTYYEFPSWGDYPPSNPTANTLYTEQFVPPAQVQHPQVPYNTNLNLFAQEGLFIGPLYDSDRNYPTLNSVTPVSLQLVPVNGGSVVYSGDTLYIRTQEYTAGNDNLLGAWPIPSLYYYNNKKKKDPHQLWTIRKKDTRSGQEIRYGDEVYFINNNYSDQWMLPYWSKVYSAIYLTTKKNADYYWQILQRSTISAAIAKVATGSTGNLEVFAIGTSGILYHNYFDKQWHAWTTNFNNAPLVTEVVTGSTGLLNVFAIGVDNILFHCYFDGGWSNWEPNFNNAPLVTAVATGSTGLLNVFAIGLDGTLFHNYYDGGWNGWTRDFKGAPKVTAVATGSARGAMQAFAIGIEGTLYHNYYYGGWSIWKPNFDGAPLVSAVVTGEAEHLHAFIIDLDSRLLHNYFDRDRWNGWTPAFNGGPKITAVTAGSNGSLQVFAIGDDGTLYHNSFDGKNKKWGNWQAGFDGAPKVSSVTTSSERLLEVFAVGLDDGVLYHNYYYGKWHGWTANFDSVQ